MDQERRLYQRLALTKPLDAWFGDFAVRLLDVSAIGALIEYEDEIPVGSRALLRFYWREDEVEILAEMVRRDDARAGLHFLEDSATLRRHIGKSATEVLRAQQANLDGVRERNVISGDQTLTAASAGLRAPGFVAHIFEEGKWTTRRALLPDQPPNGFTLSAGEAADQVDLLRATYENGDAEARRLTRLLAELSVASLRSSP